MNKVLHELQAFAGADLLAEEWHDVLDIAMLEIARLELAGSVVFSTLECQPNCQHIRKQMKRYFDIQ
jgi:hypothetical protein